MLLQVLGVLLATIIARIAWRRYKYDLHKIPSPPGLPLLGHTLEFIFGQPNHQMSQWTGRCLKQLGYPKLMRVRLDPMDNSAMCLADGFDGHALLACDRCGLYARRHVLKDISLSKSSKQSSCTGRIAIL